MKENEKKIDKRNARKGTAVESVMKDLNLYLQDYLDALKATVVPKENLN